MLSVLCSPAQAQQPKIPRVGILFMGGKDQPHLEALKKGLSELGYSEGKNIKAGRPARRATYEV